MADSPRFTDLFIRRPVLSLVLSLLILLAGTSAIFSLQVREYPQLESASIEVITSYPGATQAVMQGFVTTPLAQAIASASGIEYLTSSSTQGRSRITAQLSLDADTDRALTEVLAKVQQVKYRLPAGVTDPVISKVTAGAWAIQYIALISDTLPIAQLHDFATRVAQPMFTAIPGVSAVDVSGGPPPAMRLWLDPVKLAARGLTAGDIAEALLENNVQAAPGRVKGVDTVINMTAGTDLVSVDEFRDMIVKRGVGGVVRLADVATVELGGQHHDSSARTSGRRSITVSIHAAPDANPLEIISAAKALLPGLQRAAPPEVEISNQFDTAHFVRAALDELALTLIEAVMVVVAVIFLFMGSPRAVIIPVVTIPLSLIGTAALLLIFGFSINLLTLLAAVLAIGLVVDDAIVVVENIHRHIENGSTPMHAALLGAREIVSPVISMTITLAAVYAPIGLMGGLTGALFKEFAFTLAAAVVVSGVVALTLSPMMSSLLLRSRSGEGRFERAVERHMEHLAAAYARLLRYSIGAPRAILSFGAVVLVAIAVMFTAAKRELAPAEDHGYLYMQIDGPRYANLHYTERYAEQVEELFRALPEYRSSWFGNGIGSSSHGSGGVNLTEWQQRERRAAQIMAELNAGAAAITGVSAAAYLESPLPASGGGLPIQMALRSPQDFAQLYVQMEALKAAARSSGLFSFVDSDLAFDSPEARIEIDRDKAGELGISMAEIARTLAVLVGENYINHFNHYERSYDVIAQVRAEHRLTPESVGRYYLRTTSGRSVPLATVIRVEMRPAPSQLPQFNQMNTATLSAVPAPGVSMGEAVRFLSEQSLPPGAAIDWLGASRQYVMEGDRLTWSFLFALVVIFLVLSVQFESFRDPLVILVTVPLAICGALLPLYLQYATLNIYTQIGLVTLIGLITKHGILMVSFANDIQRRDQIERGAAIERAAVVRMRPVLMTTAAMVAGLVPLLFSDGAGAASRHAIGVVVVTGMVFGTLFTLFVLPTIYSQVARDHRVSAVKQ